MNGFFTDQDSSGVDGQIVGKTLDQLTILENIMGKRMVLFPRLRFQNNGINICLGKPEYFSQFTNNGLSLKGIICC